MRSGEVTHASKVHHRSQGRAPLEERQVVLLDEDGVSIVFMKERRWHLSRAPMSRDVRR
jgi:hypothetical protein